MNPNSDADLYGQKLNSHLLTKRPVVAMVFRVAAAYYVSEVRVI